MISNNIIEVITIFDITYSKKEVDEEIDALVGPPYSYIKRLKLGGIGSERALILDASPDLLAYLQYEDAPNFCNFELRPEGMITHINYRLQDIAWVIPYRKSSLYQSEKGFKVFCDASFLALEKIYKGSDLDKFMQKMMHLRAQYLGDTLPPF